MIHGSEEWHAARLGKITGSGFVLTPSGEIMDKFTTLERQLRDLREAQEHMHRRIRALEELVSQLRDATQPMTRVPFSGPRF